LPVIVSETAGASEVLEDKKTAMIVPPYSPESIAQAAEELVQNPTLYTNISRDGRSFVVKNISWEHYAAQLLELCKDAGAK
jgi:glycosyltransferase involved in cell wall biosynthesis